MRAWGIVVGAGQGRRFGGSKQEAILGGRELWVWARDALAEAGVEEVVLVGPMPGGVPGGGRRRDSVAAGLARVPEGVPVVLVHDAARPLADAALARRVLEGLEEGDPDGVVPAVGIRDTLKRVEDGRVVESLDRSQVIAVQTPQGFRAAILRRAHQADSSDASDDASLVERVGGQVAVVPGDPANLKITYPEDLVLAEALLERRERGESR